MQQGRRTNLERSGTTRAALIGAARELFVEHGYAATSTPDIAARAGVTRGALYHQFADKQALFEAVLISEAQAVAAAIEATSLQSESAGSPLVEGAQAYLRAMRTPGRCRLLLVDGPTVLGLARMHAIDLDAGARTLVAGLREVAPDTDADKVIALADMLSAAFDKAALLIDQGAKPASYKQAVIDLLLAAAERLSQGRKSCNSSKAD